MDDDKEEKRFRKQLKINANIFWVAIFLVIVLVNFKNTEISIYAFHNHRMSNYAQLYDIVVSKFINPVIGTVGLSTAFYIIGKNSEK